MVAIVKILQGTLEGTQGKDYDGNNIYKFLGIPYAKPPVGDLRFREPQPPESWVGVRESVKDGSSCFHKNDFIHQYEGSEDCLYLNVFTRELPQDGNYNLKPVMVWIHGGGFTGGSNSSQVYGPDFLLMEDVVLVSINYRFGLLGFLRLKDPVFNISGNMGFKDQVQALRWVRNNIQQFNGDPDNVTLFGESAGSASVHFHVLSPMSRDLFHKAILQSGAALNCWADECDHSVVQIAKFHNPSISTEKEALNILKNLTVEELYELQVIFIKSIEHGAQRPIGLVIEPQTKKTAFLNKRPIDIITSGEYNKVPMIFGYNNREGILFNYQRQLTGGAEKVLPEYFIPHNVNLKSNSTLRWTYIEKLRNLYLNGPDKEDAVMIITDAWFLSGIIGSVKNHSQTSPYPIYLYKLSLDTELNFVKKACKLTEIFGCSHGDDLGYLFKTPLTPQIAPSSIEDVTLRRFVRLWANFARSGNPTPDATEFGLSWKPAMTRQLNTLHIYKDLTIEVNPEGKRMDLWRQLYHQSNATVKYL
nr:carboxylesterase COEC1 [Dendroctonus valens]